MTGTATSLLNQIKTKVKDPVTKKPRYKNSDAVIEEALEVLYAHLKTTKQL
tara:strand:+ start:2091 stop:2243 length:153 start_codon:yes stop_codon:yes gene_type:complete